MEIYREGYNDGKMWKKHKHLLDDIKEKRRYWILKEAAMDCTVWGTRFGRGYGPVIRRTTERLKPCKM